MKDIAINSIFTSLSESALSDINSNNIVFQYFVDNDEEEM